MSILRALSLRQSSWTFSRVCTRAASSKAASKAPAAPEAKPSEAPAAPAASSSNAAPLSSCPPNTVLTGVNYLKGQQPVTAQPDEAYPEWLWTCLQPKVYEDDGPGGKLERVKRRAANRQAIKDRNFMQTQK
ncbi:hypothetical protein CVT24_005521 [Panaeolus cyanescens]|uniref:Large ribosomal subunit protein mL54 n=1 Tax=Panaeolus cyanescens TaxID=181874 RepID=A0A409YBW7_9AGAR|nr:hypothetical protein CVT24_005521 [Panaeolus cyanescens]